MNSLYLFSIFVNSIIQARWIIPDYYDDYYYETERNSLNPSPLEFDTNIPQEDQHIYPVYTERNSVNLSPLEFDTNIPQEDQDIYPVYTERNSVNPSPLEFDTNIPQEDQTILTYTNGDEYYPDQRISNIVSNFNDTEFDSNTQTDKEDNYEREYELDFDFKKVDLYNISFFLGYITLNQVLLKFHFCLFHYIVILIYK
jgi:hypothetical protein